MDVHSNRRSVVKGLGAGVAALVAGALAPRAVGAARGGKEGPRGKSECAKACQERFPAKEQRGARRRCVSTCARGG